jgi:uncharacterized protein involved in exopolysaccharide biosynthesis
MAADGILYEGDILPLPGEDVVSSVAGERRGGFSLLDVMIVLASRKKLIVWVTATFTLAGALTSFLLPSRYTATASVLPPQQNTSLGAALASQATGLFGVASLASGTLGLKNPNDIYVGMLRSRTAEDAMVQRYGLMAEYRKRYLSDARKVFERRSTVDGSNKDGLIHITLWDYDPARAAELTNGYVDEFRDLSEHLAMTEAAQRRLFFEKQLQETKDNLASAEEALKATELETGLVQLDSQARALVDSAAQLRAQITAKQVQIRALETFATDQNAELVQAEQELQALQSQLAKLGGASDGSDAGLIVPKGRVPQASLEYARRLRDVRYYETIFDILARQFEVAKLDEAREGAVIQVVDAATQPDKRSFPQRTLISIGSMVLGLVAGVAAAVGSQALRSFQRDPAYAQKLRSLRAELALADTADRDWPPLE